MRVTLAGLGPGLDAAPLAVPRRTALLSAYTAGTIVIGMVSLLVATSQVGLWEGIAIPGLDPAVAPLAGLVAWTAFALLGGTRMLRDPGGHAVLTLHLPFIIAAMVLGGPVAGAWVAFLGTFDRRELREVPWYGILANHSGLALSALAGGAAVAAVVAVGRLVTPSGGFVLDLIAAVAGTLVLAVLSAALAAGVVVLRDGLTIRDTFTVLDRSFRATAVAETLLGWLLVVAWVSVGWWTPAVCMAIILALWRASEDAAALDRDDLTGVLSGRAFALRTADAADRARRGIEGSAYLFLDLDDFKAVNDGPGSHLVGDQVLVEVGRRLRDCVRVTDAVGRRGGDEFVVLFTGVNDEAVAMSLARRVRDTITAPYLTDDGAHSVGASIGLAMIVSGQRDFEPDIRQRADAAMYAAKGAGGGIHAWGTPVAD